MRLIPILACLALIWPAAAAAEESAPPATETLRKALEEALEAFDESLRPAVDDLLEGLRALESIDDLGNYQTPEVLPNGDILIRRAPDAPPLRRNEPDAAPPSGIEPELRL